VGDRLDGIVASSSTIPQIVPKKINSPGCGLSREEHLLREGQAGRPLPLPKSAKRSRLPVLARNTVTNQLYQTSFTHCHLQVLFHRYGVPQSCSSSPLGSIHNWCSWCHGSKPWMASIPVCCWSLDERNHRPQQDYSGEGGYRIRCCDLDAGPLTGCILWQLPLVPML
jgi:hypothetical protein